MSVFSFMKKGRQQAKEHNGKVSESASQESKAAYKHVPTHAGVDALLGAPNSCQGDYKHRILEQHRRRSAIAVSVKSASSAAIPRITSSLSCVTYPSDYNSPPVPSSKVQSSTSFLQTCSQRSPRYDGSENYFSQPTSGKGKQQECIPLVPTLPLAYTSATGAHPHSSIESGKAAHDSRQSGSSSSSEEDLEVRHSRSVSYITSSSKSGPYLYDHTRQRGRGVAAAQNIRPLHQSKVSDSHISRGHRFTAPKPMDHEVLSTQTISAFPVPPLSSLASIPSTPAISNPVSYASSARSGVSTAPSSTSSTPAASIMASFPSADNPPSLTLGGAGKAEFSAQRSSKPWEITSGKAAGKERGSIVEPIIGNQKRRWTFLGARRSSAAAA